MHSWHVHYSAEPKHATLIVAGQHCWGQPPFTHPVPHLSLQGCQPRICLCLAAHGHGRAAGGLRTHKVQCSTGHDRTDACRARAAGGWSVAHTAVDDPEPRVWVYAR